MHPLSERLSLIMSLIPDGVSVCDVGCDHAYLAAALALSGRFSSVTATDIGENPLSNARKNLQKLGVSGITLLMSDGLEGVKRQQARYTVIAGMGGDVISGIIDRCPYKNEIDFILQPMTGAATLREYLAQNGFEIKSEFALKENGKLYSVMHAAYSGKAYALDGIRKHIGLLQNIGGAATEYIKKQYRICKKCANSIKDIEEKGEEYLQLQKELLLFSEILGEENGV